MTRAGDGDATRAHDTDAARAGTPHAAESRARDRRVVAGAVLLGVGVMAAVDEIVFHQLLQWHHFYDRSTPPVGVVSDGLLHTAELFAIVAGALLLLDARPAGRSLLAWGAFLMGAGGFQVFDGVVDHKVLRVHQIRYGVDLLPYDLAWITGGALLFAAGVALYLRARRRPGVPA